jgi:uncharacterized protein (DUF2267 family)
MIEFTEGDGDPACPVESAARAELAAMGPRAAFSTMGAMVLNLARRLDQEDAAGGAAQLAQQLRAGLLELWKAFPPVAEDDELDMLRKRRSAG